MTTSDKLREIAEKWGWLMHPIFETPVDKVNSCLSDLTALISENYVDKAKYDEAVRQRDELKEALKQLVHLHGCEQEGLLSGQPTPEQWYKVVEQAEAAIKSIENNNQ